MKFFFAPLALVVSCATPLILEPPAEGPGSSYPCGVGNPVCPGRMCCTQGYVCGGENFSACPVGQCCFEGDGRLVSDAGVVVVPQWSPQ
jgi:hypothetical protein